MKNFRLLILTLSVILFVYGNALAVPINVSGANGETDLQTILNDITVNGDSSVNVTTDFLNDSLDSDWQLTASGGSVSTIIIEIAGYANSNSFGVYNGNSFVELFKGMDGSVDLITFSLLENLSENKFYTQINGSSTGDKWDTQYFGYYLDTPNGRFFSDTSLNSDNVDHMLAYQGTGDLVQISNSQFARPEGPWSNQEYVLAWEDLNNGGDRDYNDFVVMVESVEPVPEPATMVLLGLGLIGLGTLGRKKGMFAKSA